MLIDAETLAADTTLDADVTVVGAGPAGIVVALELAREGFDVTLVESGRLRPDAELQALGDAHTIDPARHAPMDECTRRQLGGASVIWGGRCVPYDPVDFDRRPFVPHSDWPVGYDDVAGYFQRANDYFFCGEATYDLHRLRGVAQTSIVPGLPDGDVTTSSLERWSLPTNFGKEYRQALAASRRIRLVYSLTCTEIETSEGGDAVACIRAQTLGGASITLRSRRYVIACGGLETTRLLMVSDARHPGGIGNHADHLGRYYMGHLSGEIANVRFTTDPERTVYGFDRDAEGVYLRRRFAFSREFQHAEQLTNIVSWLVNPKIWDPAHGNGVLSFAYLALTSPLGPRFASAAIRKAAAGGDGPVRATGPHLRNMWRDLPRTLRFIPSFGYGRFLRWRRTPGFFQKSAANVYPLHYHAEQVPNPHSRVQLSRTADRLGMRRLDIDLAFTDVDVDAVVRAHRHWDAYLRRHGVGQLDYLTDRPAERVWEQAADGFHQCGTTRMSADPADGVVDANCAVHGVGDLFVASSSVFVTSGQANSTFMIVAFGLRLAEHIAASLRSRGT